MVEQPSISNGAIYSDLDNDGDLDIVTNNINQVAFVLENKTVRNNYLKIKLKGPKANINAIGAVIEVCAEGDCQKYYQSPVRGYLSSVDPIIHVGLGAKTKVDKIVVQWYLGTHARGAIFSSTIKENIPVNQLFNIDYNEGERLVTDEIMVEPSRALFRKIEVDGLNVNHEENFYRDFDFQPLLLKQLSKQGPCLAVGNIDGKAGDELFIGGAKGKPGKIYFEQSGGSYASQALADSTSEDTDAVFVDIDKDGDLDLYVVSGGSEYLPEDPKLQDRVYLNNGTGQFTKSEQYQSPVKESGGVVTFSKPDKNGDRFLFVGGRLVPGKFPNIPTSALLTNHYENLIQNTDKFAAGLSKVGMVTDAIFSDYNQDGTEDLVLTTDWGALEIFENGGSGYFSKKDLKIYPAEDTSKLFQPKGFWSSIAAGDFDKDGDTDYLLGNLGENTNLKATEAEPLYLYKGDFDKNGGTDPLVGHYYSTKDGQRKSFPLHARDDVVKQLVKVKGRFKSYADFGKATFSEILSDTELKEDFLEVNYLKSSYLENKGDGQFVIHALPLLTQLAPIQSILVEDFDKDGNLDALMVGNDYSAESSGGQQDAFNGLFLKGNGKGTFEAISTGVSGFYCPGDGRDIVKLTNRKGKNLIVVGQNEGSLLIYKY